MIVERGASFAYVEIQPDHGAVDWGRIDHVEFQRLVIELQRIQLRDVVEVGCVERVYAREDGSAEMSAQQGDKCP